MRSSVLGNTYVNASLIHEVRMLVVHGLRAFNEGKRGSGPRLRQRPVTNIAVDSWVPKCSICMQRKKLGSSEVARPAVTMQNGNALCEIHI